MVASALIGVVSMRSVQDAVPALQGDLRGERREPRTGSARAIWGRRTVQLRAAGAAAPLPPDRLPRSHGHLRDARDHRTLRRQMITQNVCRIAAIRAAALENGMRTMGEDGILAGCSRAHDAGRVSRVITSPTRATRGLPLMRQAWRCRASSSTAPRRGGVRGRALQLVPQRLNPGWAWVPVLYQTRLQRRGPQRRGAPHRHRGRGRRRREAASASDSAPAPDAPSEGGVAARLSPGKVSPVSTAAHLATAWPIGTCPGACSTVPGDELVDAHVVSGRSHV